VTQVRRIEKLEAQVASLRERLGARTTQVIMLLDQIGQLKDALAEHGLEVKVTPVVLDEVAPPA
jgi:hypothetical protein